MDFFIHLYNNTTGLIYPVYIVLKDGRIFSPLLEIFFAKT